MNKLFLLACAVFIVGCGTPATYKDPQGRELVVSLDKVNIQDFATAGSQSSWLSGHPICCPRRSESRRH